MFKGTRELPTQPGTIWAPDPRKKGNWQRWARLSAFQFYLWSMCQFSVLGYRRRSWAEREAAEGQRGQQSFKQFSRIGRQNGIQGYEVALRDQDTEAKERGHQESSNTQQCCLQCVRQKTTTQKYIRIISNANLCESKWKLIVWNSNKVGLWRWDLNKCKNKLQDKNNKRKEYMELNCSKDLTLSYEG